MISGNYIETETTEDGDSYVVKVIYDSSKMFPSGQPNSFEKKYRIMEKEHDDKMSDIVVQETIDFYSGYHDKKESPVKQTTDNETLEAKLRNVLTPIYGLAALVILAKDNPDVNELVYESAKQVVNSDKRIRELLKAIEAEKELLKK